MDLEDLLVLTKLLMRSLEDVQVTGTFAEVEKFNKAHDRLLSLLEEK